MPLKLQTVCLLLLLNSVSSGQRRGPHHPHGQTPVDHKHHHYKPKGSVALTGDTQLLHDTKTGKLRQALKVDKTSANRVLNGDIQRKHIEEDSEVLTAEMLSKMTAEELEFHYFSAHDFDRNSMLDGLELLKAVYHTLEHEAQDPDKDNSIEPEANDLETYIELVDRTLYLDDRDGDGCISYAEYRAARANSPSARSARVLASNTT